MDCELHQAASASGSILIAVALCSAALLHSIGWRRLRRQAPGIPPSDKRPAFLGALLVVFIVIASPLSTLDHQRLTFHMLQHLLLMTVAAPLLLLATPGAALLRGLPRRVRRAATRLLRSDAAQRIGRALTNPIACWIAGTGIVIVWHLPPAHELSMRAQPWHLAQHVSFLAAGLLFWWPVVGSAAAATRMPSSSAPLYLFLATLPCDALSAFLTFCGRAIYPSHASAHPMSGLSALQDQELAGALMWFWVTIAYLLPAVVITLRMLSPRAREAGSG